MYRYGLTRLHPRASFRARTLRALRRCTKIPNSLAVMLDRLWKYSYRVATAVSVIVALLIFFNQNELQSVQRFKVEYIIYPAWIVVALVILRLVAFLYDFAGFMLESAIVADITRFGELPIQPSTREYIEYHKLNKPAAGGVVELIADIFLDRNLTDNGWQTRDVAIILDKERISALSFAKELVEYSGENNVKYTLRRFSSPLADNSAKLEINVIKTDWQHVLSSRRALQSDIAMRHKLLDPSFSNNTLPSSLCLHVVCLTSDNNFIVMKRAKLEFNPGELSVSFEEQLSDIDMSVGNDRMENWFRRTLCEEIFPAAGPYKSNPKSAWESVAPHVEFMRVWSLFLEEQAGNFALLGVCRLRFSAGDFKARYDQIQADIGGRSDNEGRLYYMSLAEIKRLLSIGSSTMHDLSFPEYSEDTGVLHHSSLYRAAMVASCMV